jgi:hypothetical protein
MTTEPDKRLADHAAMLREASDTGILAPAQARFELARAGQVLLAAHPNHSALWQSFAILRDRSFNPPPPMELPSGSPTTLRTLLSGRQNEDLRELATAFVTVPDPEQSLETCMGLMELLLLIPEHARADALLEQLKPHVAPELAAFWRLRLKLTVNASETEELDEFNTLLALSPPGSIERVLGSMSMAASRAHLYSQTSAITPLCGNSLVANTHLSVSFDPELRNTAAEVLHHVSEALDQLSQCPPISDPLTALILQAEEADRQGRFTDGSQTMVQALTRYPLRKDLAMAARRRAELTLDAQLSALLNESGVIEGDSLDLGRIQRVSSRPLDTTSLNLRSKALACQPPDQWTDRCVTLASEGKCRDDHDRFFLEAAGARYRAALSWLEVGDIDALRHVARLFDTLQVEDHNRWLEGIRQSLSTNTSPLKKHGLRDLAFHLWKALPEGPEKYVLERQLKHVASTSPPRKQEKPSTDPHDPANRLAAASDLILVDRIEAASAIVVAVLRRADDDSLDSEICTLVQSLLRLDTPPLTAEEAVARRIRQGDTLASALVRMLIDDPRAAHAIHGPLISIGADKALSDKHRVDTLQAWLGIWKATGSSPPASTIRPLMSGSESLLLMAAGKALDVEDPVAYASVFLDRMPTGSTSAAEWARNLLEWSAVDG